MDLSLYRSLLAVLLLVSLSACKEGGGSGDSSSVRDETSTQYPYLLSEPRITYLANIYDTSKYDVTVELDATGPDPIYSIDLWLYSDTDETIFANLDLEYIGGNTWSATTNPFLALPAGSYHLDSIMIEDGDPLDGGQVRMGWYTINSFYSSSYYTIDQRLTDWSTLELLNSNFGVSNIHITHFTLP